jgi:hypothetical protein
MKTGITASLFLLSALAPACCSIGFANQPIQFGMQENVVIYNSKTKTEYFIRNARFTTDVPKDFAFIAPTPSYPTLSKVDPEIFEFLSSKQPQRDTASKPSEGVAASKSLDIETVMVAGYEATIIKGGDSQAVTDYLTKNGYKATNDAKEWVDFYVKKGWYLTAFKLINKSEALETGVICMKFKTDEPFNPYYVPESNRGGSGTVKFALISDQYMEPDDRVSANELNYQWMTTLNGSDMAKVAGFLSVPAGDLPSAAYLSDFFDSSFPTSAKDDLYFYPATTKQDLPVELPLPALIAGAALSAGVIYWGIRASKKQ